MAEILLSLTIIGVVAAITLPSLTGNINERTWNTQRKALYARMSQAIALMPSINGYGTLSEDESGCVTEDTAAETFLTSGLSKVLKINNICDSEHLEDCGIPQKVTKMNGENAFSSFPKTLLDFNEEFSVSYSNPDDREYYYSQINTKAAAFETANGESVVVYYNPRCSSDKTIKDFLYSQSLMCANFVYDLNGSKGPNTVGKDIGFMSVVYASDSVVAAPKPLQPTGISGDLQEAIQYCRNNRDNARVPNLEELMSIFYNKNLLGVGTFAMWSTTKDSNGHNYMLRLWSGTIGRIGTDTEREIYCVER
ncbi:MAG: type II secretion system GspH family protein [Fusobacterium sp.]|nr:type II secretion system GspH family protein [Fusobacterium sp.]